MRFPLALLLSFPLALPAAEERLLAPVHVHLLISDERVDLCTTLMEADITRIFGKVNRVWAQAQLGFYVASIQREAPGVLPEVRPALGWLLDCIPPATYRAGQYHLYYVKEFAVNGVYFPRAIFVKDSARLRHVEGGIDEPLPRVTSHELGHSLGLVHRQDTYNLMASGTTGTLLNEEEVEIARKCATELGRFWPVCVLQAQAASLRALGLKTDAERIEAAVNYRSDTTATQPPSPRTPPVPEVR